jgi:hypothetical protein
MTATLNTTVIQNASSSTPNITLDTVGNALFGNMPYGTSSFLRNRIINGNMAIAQYGTGSSTVTSSGYYACDRWQQFASQSSKFSVQQNAGSVTTPAGFPNYLGVTSSSAYSVLTGDFFGLAQYIEGYNISDLAWGTAAAKTVTLSFLVYSSLTGTFGGSLGNNGQSRTYPFSYTISSANTWTTISVTIPGDTTGTWLTTNGRGIGVYFGLGVGTTYSGTAGAWAGAQYFVPTGAVSVVGTSGAIFYITGVQLEQGSVATPFERPLFSKQLADCQRYYEKSYAQGTAPGTIVNIGNATLGIGGSGNDVAASSVYKVVKRASPTVVPYSADTGTANAIRNYNSGSDVTSINTEGNDSQFRVYKSASITSGQFYGWCWTASAEL